ncbi:NTP transferase domain-containing protein [Candidatus Woesearchaeota archaeon]|nr:NTP transferase domain-containing protein [Candidatus Woesearchaeota archaeon]
MQTVILCGGEGTRLREYTEAIPKPMVEVGGKPIIWHIMKIYSHYGHDEFILCLGYKGEKIREYFGKNNSEKWKITFVDTGEKSNKAERLMQAKGYIKDENFLVAYGDDVSDVDINKVIELHRKSGKIVTLTAVNPESQFGVLKLNSDIVEGFIEKPKLEQWVNGGFFCMKSTVFSHLRKGHELEDETFKELASKKEIAAYKHSGFWKCMNVFKDVVELNDLWNKGNAPWKVWED